MGGNTGGKILLGILVDRIGTRTSLIIYDALVLLSLAVLMFIRIPAALTVGDLIRSSAALRDGNFLRRRCRRIFFCAVASIAACSQRKDQPQSQIRQIKFLMFLLMLKSSEASVTVDLQAVQRIFQRCKLFVCQFHICRIKVLDDSLFIL